MPHGQDATSIPPFFLRLSLEPRLLLIEQRSRDIAVEADDPPVTHLHAEPGVVWRALAEVLQKILRRAIDIVVIAGNSVRVREERAPCRRVTSLERHTISMRVGGVTNDKNNSIARNHLRGPGCRAFSRRFAFAFAYVTRRVCEYSTPRGRGDTQKHRQQPISHFHPQWPVIIMM